jgi:hypothetical protein
VGAGARPFQAGPQREGGGGLTVWAAEGSEVDTRGPPFQNDSTLNTVKICPVPYSPPGFCAQANCHCITLEIDAVRCLHFRTGEIS